MENYETSTRTYIAIDLKSFYASVECVERGLDTLTTNLVVADESRTDKTICLAVSPSLKAYGIPGRARLFEVKSRVKEINSMRLIAAGRREFSGSSASSPELKADPSLGLDFIIATPHMSRYMEYSRRVFEIYMRYVAPEDIHVYSVDEIFADVTHYLGTYKMTAAELARVMINAVLKETGITATAGIGTNLYLAKVAMDIWAKHMEPDENGVRIAELDETSYRRNLWNHRPLTDFWRVGRGYADKLEKHGIYTMGDVARCSLGKDSDYYNEELLYGFFGINAELLIDHAWGYEPVTIADIKAYKPETNSISCGQVLSCPYTCEKARLIIKEMADSLVLDLVDKELVTDQLVLTVGYDTENVTAGRVYEYGSIVKDRYGRKIPKHAHGTVNLEEYSSSTSEIVTAVLGLYDQIINPDLLVRRINLTACRVINTGQNEKRKNEEYVQLDLFSDPAVIEKEKEEKRLIKEREEKMQRAVLAIKKRYGKNAVLKGMNLEEGATAMERNGQVGGHRA